MEGLREERKQLGQLGQMEGSLMGGMESNKKEKVSSVGMTKHVT
jgi:hypothetical protein